jgi:redox-sensitive bicupin YhaK (pirin superfamily)
MGNERTLRRGEVQYLSAGTGILHSEYNHHKSKDLRLLQMWIIPPQTNLEPIYGEELYKPDERDNKLLHVVSNQEGNAKVKIHQDVNIYVAELTSDNAVDFTVGKNRQVYFVQIEGSSSINGIILDASEAMEITNENHLRIEANAYSHFLFIEMSQ